MKLTLIALVLMATSSLLASSSKVECIKSAKKSGKKLEEAYQACSVKENKKSK